MTDVSFSISLALTAAKYLQSQSWFVPTAFDRALLFLAHKLSKPPSPVLEEASQHITDFTLINAKRVVKYQRSRKSPDLTITEDALLILAEEAGL